MTGNDELEGKDADFFKNSLEEHFKELEDYRRERSVDHKLLNILFVTICAVISGANNLKAVSAYAIRKQKWLTNILELQMCGWDNDYLLKVIGVKSFS